MTAPAATKLVVAPDSTPKLTTAEYNAIADLAYAHSRILLHEGKEGLVVARLSKRLRALGLSTYSDYLSHIASDRSGEELSQFIDLLTTNKTHFFRESSHFDFFAQQLVPAHLKTREPLRVWSAGCSSGEEPYTLSMLLHDTASGAAARDARILATDISSRVLAQAVEATYAIDTVRTLPPTLAKKYLTQVAVDRTHAFRVKPEIRSIVKFARLNLMGPWPMRQQFHAIFCRNVMIYFDRKTQEQLVQRFAAALAPGGFFFVGHSESLNAIEHPLRYVAPALYVK